MFSSTSSELNSDSSSSDSSSEEPSETLDSYRIEFELPNWSPAAERPRLHYWGSENNAISWDVDGESNMTLKEGTTFDSWVDNLTSNYDYFCSYNITDKKFNSYGNGDTILYMAYNETSNTLFIVEYVMRGL